MVIALLAAFPLLLTEYGLQTRVRILDGFRDGWRPRRTIIRLGYWIVLLALAGLRPAPVLFVVIGFAVGEVGALLLRRRMRIDIGKGRPHGSPATHLVPIGVAIIAIGYPILLSLTSLQGFPVAPAQIARIAIGALFGIVALWGWATMLTVSVVDLVRPGQIREEEDSVGAGEVIGVLERLVTLALVLGGAFTAVGFVVAAKAAARFPLFKEKEFAEYFLIGTLTSVGLALALGLLFRASS